jgi:adenine-specific DNA-methyltransferase
MVFEKNSELFKLQKEIERLKKSIKKQRYGLVWMDIPEAFEDDVENKLPILKEVPELAIKNEDGKPQHILIEGDNYHALTCLNYTHKGKIDVIYIDPPYNTGSDGFRYKDKRIIDKFPDGTEVPKDHPFRHSYWLSFMRKRLELARDLLKEDGCIFISIDENEIGQIKLLCDELFSENNCHGILTWIKRTKPTNMGKARFKLQQNVEYILMYSKCTSEQHPGFILEEGKNKEYPDKGKHGKCRFEPMERRNVGTMIRDTMIYELLGVRPRNGYRWQISKKEADRLLSENKIELVDGKPNIAVYPEDEDNISYVPFWSHLLDIGTAENGKAELSSILGYEHHFDTVKPLHLIIKILKQFKQNSIVLDFFAGSGTTGHAVLELNNKKNNLQFIICTDNENNICSEICYPRIKKVMRGYRDQKNNEVKGLGNSLKYYKTAFIGENNILNANDEDKVELAHNAGELLAIAENTLESVKQTKYYQLFEDNLKEKYTAIYFREELDQFDKFVQIVEKLNKKTAVYVFSWGQDEFIEEFENLKNINVKTIPVPILEIYKNIYNLGN